MKAIIPVAGKGSRMYPLSEIKPKPLIKIVNKPLICWNIESLVQAGIKDIAIVIADSEQGEAIKIYLSNKYPNINLHFPVQTEQMGTAHVLKTAATGFIMPGDKFIFINGDDLYDFSMISSLIRSNTPATIAKKFSDTSKYSAVVFDELANFIDIVEKPTTFISEFVNINCILLDHRAIRLIDELQISPRGECEMPDLLRKYAQNYGLKVVTSEADWWPVGYPWEVLTVNLIKGKTAHSSERISSEVLIPDNVHISSDCVIGSQSTIGEGSKLVSCVIGSNVQIGKNCRLSYSVIADGTKIGDNFNAISSLVEYQHLPSKQNITTLIKGSMLDTGLAQLGVVIAEGVTVGEKVTCYPGIKISPGVNIAADSIIDKDIFS